ncbi:MAG: hypothetical protein ACE5IW_09925 [bacterium]
MAPFCDLGRSKSRSQAINRPSYSIPVHATGNRQVEIPDPLPYTQFKLLRSPASGD